MKEKDGSGRQRSASWGKFEVLNRSVGKFEGLNKTEGLRDRDL